MTQINIHGLLADEFGSSFKMDIGRPDLVFEAIDANRSGFKKRVFDLHKEGFDYAILIDKKKIKNKEDVLVVKKAETIDLVPVLGGAGGVGTWIAVGLFAASTAVSILLAPKPPKPAAAPEIRQSTNASQTSFSFSNIANRAAQGTPVPVGYGEMIVGSEVIQSTIKSYPIGLESSSAFKRNPRDEDLTTSEAQTQFLN